MFITCCRWWSWWRWGWGGRGAEEEEKGILVLYSTTLCSWYLWIIIILPITNKVFFCPFWFSHCIFLSPVTKQKRRKWSIWGVVGGCSSYCCQWICVFAFCTCPQRAPVLQEPGHLYALDTFSWDADVPFILFSLPHVVFSFPSFSDKEQDH